MRRILPLLRDYLKKAEALESFKLGDQPKAITIATDEQDILVKRLLAEGKFNNKIVVSVTVLLFALFALAVCLVYYYRDSPGTVAAVLGGSVLSLLAITSELKKLWREKWAIDIMVAILPGLTPDEAIKLVKTIYFSQVEVNTAGSKKLTSEEGRETGRK